MTLRELTGMRVSSVQHLAVPGVLLVILLCAVAVVAPRTYSYGALAGAIIILAPLILATLALTPIALAGRGGVDLSVGPLLGFINVTTVSWLVGNQFDSPAVVFLFAIGVGVIYQLLQGLVIVYVRVSPIIVSLSGYLVLSGLSLSIMDRPSGSAPAWMAGWGGGQHIGTPVLAILVAAIVLWVFVSRTAFFSRLRLTGFDERMSFASGVHVDLIRLGAHLLAGVYVGLAAITYTALIGSGDPTQGSTYTLAAVTALVLGGTSLAGGRGGGLGSILGAVNIYLISTLLASFSFGIVSGFVTQMFTGLILLVSLLVNVALTTRLTPKPA